MHHQVPTHYVRTRYISYLHIHLLHSHVSTKYILPWNMNKYVKHNEKTSRLRYGTGVIRRMRGNDWAKPIQVKLSSNMCSYPHVSTLTHVYKRRSPSFRCSKPPHSKQVKWHRSTVENFKEFQPRWAGMKGRYDEVIGKISW